MLSWDGCEILFGGVFGSYHPARKHLVLIGLSSQNAGEDRGSQSIQPKPLRLQAHTQNHTHYETHVGYHKQLRDNALRLKKRDDRFPVGPSYIENTLF